MTKYFYVCSYGGCGSKMLCNALKSMALLNTSIVDAPQ